MQQIQVEDTVFKRILEPRMNILEFSNNLLPNHDAVQEGKGFEDYTSVESSSRKIKKELEMERIDQPDIKDIAEEKRAKINELRINTELEGANLTKEQREENNKLIFAMDVMANENEFLKLKNADDFTKKMMENKETKHKFSFIDSYNKI
jgi:hypothetical protein